MGEHEKFPVAYEGRYDLTSMSWDDQSLTDLLVRSHPIDADQALGISRFVREAISKMGVQTIPLSMIEKMIEDKLM